MIFRKYSQNRQFFDRRQSRAIFTGGNIAILVLNSWQRMFSPAAGELVGDVTFIERFKKVNVVVCSREQDFTIRKHARFFLTTLTPKIVGGLDPVQFLLFEKIADLVGSWNRRFLHQIRLRNFFRDPKDHKQVALQFNRVSLAILVGLFIKILRLIIFFYQPDIESIFLTKAVAGRQH